MIAPKRLAMLILLCATQTILPQNPPDEASAAEARAVASIQDLMRKTRQAGDKPTELDLAARREAGMGMAKRGRQFVRNYLSAGKAEDARA